jgi:hypothetical protein
VPTPTLFPAAAHAAFETLLANLSLIAATDNLLRRAGNLAETHVFRGTTLYTSHPSKPSATLKPSW